MIIDFDKKYVFIGLPYSASSAISKELLEQYNGQPLLHKHSNIPILLKARPDIDISEYYVFAVARDPVEMVFSVYNKYLTNAHGVYTEPKYFLENGGHVPKRARRLYKKISKGQWTFEEYVRRQYKSIPYDNYLSENKPYINRVIRFDHLAQDFPQCLSDVGIEVKRDLPVYNKTRKVIRDNQLPSELKLDVFGPFFCFNQDFFPNESCQQTNLFQKYRFLFFRKVRSLKWYRFDNMKKDLDRSMIN